MKKKILFYSVYERLWHWLQATTVIALIVTGFLITYSSLVSSSGFNAAVLAHNTVGIILAVNAGLALFYNLAGGLLKRYIPGFDDFTTMGFRHARYYLVGIFKGEAHPFEKTPEKRLLPLQKITYFVILNALLPLMVVTGLLKWSVAIDPRIVDHFGGLKMLATLHRFGAWLFVSFLIVHIYMTTTGRTPLSSIVGMITGYETVEEENGGGES
ncbi:MAG: cytochrome b/b6 domain-containing protein [bacterium]